MSKHKNKNQKDNVPFTTTVVGGKACHSGNVSVMHSAVTEAHLYCGGWSRGADSADVAVIDLTGTEPLDVESPFRALNDQAAQAFKAAMDSASEERTLPWLSFKIKDFGVPTVKRETWVALAAAIKQLLDQGSDVLLACQGGHGRTGTAAAIICYLLNSEVGDPVTYLRSVYCEHAVETRRQHLYVNRMCELPEPPMLEYKHEYAWTGGNTWKASNSWQPGYTWDTKTNQWVDPNKQDSKPETGMGQSYYPDFMPDQDVADLAKILEQNGYDFETPNYSMGTDVEVSIFDNGNPVAYIVSEYFRTSETVEVINIKTGESRTVPISFLAKRDEVNKHYGK